MSPIEHVAFFTPAYTTHEGQSFTVCVCVAYVLLALEARILGFSIHLGSTHFAALLFVAVGHLE